MLARLAVLLVALPALALAADVNSGGTKPASAAQATVQRAATPPVVAPSAPVSVPTDPAQCRMSCAQTYYFCRAGDHPDDCAGAWGQCVATCNSPNLATDFSTTP
jgi:hypothetical protein